MMTKMDVLMYYPIGATIEYFLDTKSTFEYMFKYFLVNAHTYPDSEWYTHPSTPSGSGIAK